MRSAPGADPSGGLIDSREIVMLTRRRTIAIIDDDPGMRLALESLLGASGYRTEMYASAEEFVRAAITTDASCLVVDIQLGDISGVELGRHLAETGFTFPIIFMTGSREEAHRRKAMDLGCVAYLSKPFPADRLIEAITKAIGSASDFAANHGG
jgi:FixJ family two-component response regulator